MSGCQKETLFFFWTKQTWPSNSSEQSSKVEKSTLSGVARPKISHLGMAGNLSPVKRLNSIPFEKMLALLTTRKIQGLPVPEIFPVTSWEERAVITFHKTLGVAQLPERSPVLATSPMCRLQVAPWKRSTKTVARGCPEGRSPSQCWVPAAHWVESERDISTTTLRSSMDSATNVFALSFRIF